MIAVESHFKIARQRRCIRAQRFFNASMAAHEQYNLSGSCGPLPDGLILCIDPCGVVTKQDVSESDACEIPQELSSTQQKVIAERNLKPRHEHEHTKSAGTVRMAAKLAYRVARFGGLCVMVPVCVLQAFGTSVLIKNDPQTVGRLPAWLSRANYPAMYAEWYKSRTARREGSANAEDIDPPPPAAASGTIAASAAASETPSSSSEQVRPLALDFGDMSSDTDSSVSLTASAARKRKRSGQGKKRTAEPQSRKTARRASSNGRPLGPKALEEARAAERAARHAEMRDLFAGSVQARVDQAATKARSKPYDKVFGELQKCRYVLFTAIGSEGSDLVLKVISCLQKWQEMGKTMPSSLLGFSSDVFMAPSGGEQHVEYIRMLLQEALQQMAA